MLRYLSSYLFQNENQPNENDPTQVTSSEGGEGPTSSTNDKPKDPNREREEENDTKGDGEEMDLEMREVGEEEDDWVLIWEGKPEKKEEKVGGAVVQCQPNVGLVAAPSTEEEDSDEDSEEESEEEEENSEETGLLWENKLIEHPSMSVYVDLATSIDSSIGVQTSCVSLSSIAPTSSPGDSVIVLEQPEQESEEESEEEMDFVEATLIEDPSDIENTNNAPSSPTPPTPPSCDAVIAGAQYGRRRKGHYPCMSSNSSQMPRRSHFRQFGPPNILLNAAKFYVNSRNMAAAAAAHAAIEQAKKLEKPAAPAANQPTTQTATQPSACGIANVNGTVPVPPTANGNPTGIINKNLKLTEMFPTASAAAKKRQRRNQAAQKTGTTPKGHFLQESKRRQDMQNYTRQSFVNNDRRSAQQRRVQKMPAAAAGAK